MRLGEKKTDRQTDIKAGGQTDSRGVTFKNVSYRDAKNASKTCFTMSSMMRGSDSGVQTRGSGRE